MASTEDRPTGLGEAPYSHTIEFEQNNMGSIALFLKNNYKGRVTMRLFANSMTPITLILDTGAGLLVISNRAFPAESFQRIKLVNAPGIMAATR